MPIRYARDAIPSSVTAVGFTKISTLLTAARANSSDAAALCTKLSELNLDPQLAESFAIACQRLLDAGVDAATRCCAFWVPGRIELMGKHTDYAGGRSLLCAVNRGFAVVSADRSDSHLRVLANFELSGSVAEATVSVSDTSERPLPEDWALYPAVTARRLAKNFGLALGADLALSCNLPEASGMSSSSAVVCLTFLALAARNGLATRSAFLERLPTAEMLCHYLGCIENGQSCGDLLPGDAGVGTFGGSEDHTAIMLCNEGELRQYAFCPTRLEQSIPFSAGLCMMIAVSGATAQKGAERLRDYNDAAMLARLAASAAAEGLGLPAPTTLAAVVAAVADARGVSPGHDSVKDAIAEAIKAHDDGVWAASDGSVVPRGSLLRRYEQFFTESEELVPGVASLLASDDSAALGVLVDRSQALTESHLRNTLVETEWLPAAARRLGAHAASAFGAGFGGSVWAVAPADKAEALLSAWEAEYLQRFPERAPSARFFTMRAPAPGARSVVV